MRKKLYLGDCLEVLATLPANKIDTCITDPPYELGFMGKDWDSAGISFKKETWEKVYRVLKPGAFLLAFGGTRTWHRIAVAIEDAGFEIRDTICWLQGQGFPKSYDISKGIDKKAGKEREIVGSKVGQPGYSLAPEKEDGTRGNVYEYSRSGSDPNKECEVTAPATPEAELWDGWGTALKPCFEPIIVAMKPRDDTYVENALKHGVAGLWIDGAKIPLADGEEGYTVNTWDDNAHPFGDGAGNPYTGREETEGRWPANVILDEEAAELLNRQTGNLGKSSGGGMKDLKSGKLFMGDTHPNITDSTGFGDSGGASRFFYTAKASKKERNAGLDDGEKNPHPTVKPLALMEYLCKLTRTPTGGIVIDPFMGSGTTGMACVNTGRDFIGIELIEEHYIIARKRIEHAKAILKKD